MDPQLRPLSIYRHTPVFRPQKLTVPSMSDREQHPWTFPHHGSAIAPTLNLQAHSCLSATETDSSFDVRQRAAPLDLSPSWIRNCAHSQFTGTLLSFGHRN